VLAAVTAFAAVTSLSVVGVASAYAGKPTITAGPGSLVSCDFTAKAGFTDGLNAKQALKNDWKASEHATDPGFNSKTNSSGDADVTAAVAAVPDTQFSVNNPITTTSKGKSTSCSGTVTDGTNTANVTGAKLLSAGTSNNSNPATCSGLADTSSTDGSWSSIIQWKADTAKVADTTITGGTLSALVDPDGSLGFKLSGGTATGSFAGGSSTTDAYLDAKTGPSVIAAVTGPKVDSSNAASIKALNPCEPGLKVKINKTPPDLASIKGGKGIKKVGLGPSGANLIGPPNGKPSHIDIGA